MTIVNTIGLKMLGEEDCVLDGSITQNNIPVLEQNYVEKMNANNGFTKERLFRKIGSVPDVAHLKAVQDGYNMDDVRDVRRFFADNPDYLCVNAINTGATGHIIIR
jgi:hypothetical protein